MLWGEIMSSSVFSQQTARCWSLQTFGRCCSTRSAAEKIYFRLECHVHLNFINVQYVHSTSVLLFQVRFQWLPTQFEHHISHSYHSSGPSPIPTDGLFSSASGLEVTHVPARNHQGIKASKPHWPCWQCRTPRTPTDPTRCRNDRHVEHILFHYPGNIVWHIFFNILRVGILILLDRNIVHSHLYQLDLYYICLRNVWCLGCIMHWTICKNSCGAA